MLKMDTRKLGLFHSSKAVAFPNEKYNNNNNNNNNN